MKMEKLFTTMAVLSALTLTVFMVAAPNCGGGNGDAGKTIFMVDFNEGNIDDNGDTINRGKWTGPEHGCDPLDAPGRTMWIAGAVHHDFQEMEDPDGTYSAKLGDWTPNTIQMYDDGTHGDVVAGDNVYSLELMFEDGMHLAYKYTWGTAGQDWTCTEEFPGNSRILELKDNSGDGITIRYDEFADETTNKDAANLNQNGDGTLDWTDDWNGDGLPDAQERKVDTNNDGTLDVWPEDAF
ncbi:MAG: hypothetical protein D6795_16670 [Deltaproteobacteria bacterium]|nr:MAG: hypothetical protein D6795_16670 [Deltaproteobacteria bacterium]